jgi:hypothetical protein
MKMETNSNVSSLSVFWKSPALLPNFDGDATNDDVEADLRFAGYTSSDSKNCINSAGTSTAAVFSAEPPPHARPLVGGPLLDAGAPSPLRLFFRLINFFPDDISDISTKLKYTQYTHKREAFARQQRRQLNNRLQRGVRVTHAQHQPQHLP